MSQPEQPTAARDENETPSQRHLVLWDGECAFCGRCVDWARERDASGHFEFAPYQSVDAPLMTPALRLACARAVHVCTRDGRTLVAGRAALFILEDLGWRRSSRLLALPPLVWCVELGYRLVARNRHFFGRFLFR